MDSSRRLAAAAAAISPGAKQAWCPFRPPDRPPLRTMAHAGPSDCTTCRADRGWPAMADCGRGWCAGTVRRRWREIGRAHVRTPVTTAQLVCRLLLEKKTTQHTIIPQTHTESTYSSNAA